MNGPGRETPLFEVRLKIKKYTDIAALFTTPKLTTLFAFIYFVAIGPDWKRQAEYRRLIKTREIKN